jgi:hypothetical protein
MLRTRTLAYLLVIALGSGAVFTGMSAGEDQSAEAAKKKKKKVKKAKKKKVAIKLNVEQKKNRAELMGSFKFGMTQDEVVAALGKQMDEHYAELIKETEDIATQDRLRKEKKKEVARIRKSWIEFTGQKSGWDVSIIDEQFKHGVDEGMLEYWENQGGKNQRRFFFFTNGALYKMFIQVDTNQFEGDAAIFDTFSSGMKSRYGARIWDVNDQTDLSGEGEIGVRILDKSRFYDAFCLIVFDVKLANEVAAVRKERIHEEKKDNVILNSIQDDGTDPGLDDNKGAVQDAIKGH